MGSNAVLNAASFDLSLKGNWTNNGGTFTPGSATVTFNGSSAQTIGGTATTQTFNNLTLSNTSGGVSVGGSTTTLNVNGALNLTTGSFTAPSTLNVAGNWTNNGTFTAGSGTVTFNGSGSDQTISGSVTAFNNLTVKGKGDGVTATNSVVVIPTSNSPTVASTLTNHGTLKQTQTVGSNTDFLKIGNGSGGYSYYGVNIANGSGLGSTTVSVSGNQICSQANGYPVKRCFVIDPASSASADLTFYYTFGELQTNQTPANLKSWKYNGTSWSQAGTATTASSCTSGISCNVAVTGVNAYGPPADGMETSTGPFALKESSPQAVTLADFSAVQTGDAVLLTWETNSELDNRGFNLYRGVSPGGPDRQLNQALIPSQAPGSPGGFIYTWEDRADLVPGTTYFYWVEDVDMNNVATRHGPVSVEYGAPTAVTLSRAAAVTPGRAAPWAAGLLTLLAAVAWTRVRRAGSSPR